MCYARFAVVMHRNGPYRYIIADRNNNNSNSYSYNINNNNIMRFE